MQTKKLIVIGAIGIASWYGEYFHGRLTANQEVYDMFAYTAASPSYPMGSVVQVLDYKTGKTVTVRINDRGPYIEGRIIDLSYAAASHLGIIEKGICKVHIKPIYVPKRGK